MKIYVKKFLLFPYFLFFWFANMILPDELILPVSQLQTQQVMTSQIRPLIEYLTQTWAHLVVKIDEKSSHKA